MGQDVLDQPLLPQPGNIWADVLPTTQPVAKASEPAPSHAGHRPAAVAALGAGLRRPAVPAVAASVPVMAASVPAVATSVPERRAASSLMVQLAAARSAQRAVAEWRRLRHHAPKLTDGHLPSVAEAEVNGQQVWRLRTAGFADVAEASAFCTDMRAVKAACWVVPPSAQP